MVRPRFRDRFLTKRLPSESASHLKTNIKYSNMLLYLHDFPVELIRDWHVSDYQGFPRGVT